MSDFSQQLRNHAEKSGIMLPPKILFDGKIHRFNPATGTPRGDAGWYIAKTDDGSAWASYGSWSADIKEKWYSGQKITAEVKKRIESSRRQAEKEDAKKRARTAKEAASIWDDATIPPDDCPYLLAKKIGPHNAKFYNNQLIIPAYSADKLVGLQTIDKDGSKLFLPGTPKTGSWSLIGTIEQAETILIAEGWATAATLHEATGYPVYVAWDAGNMPEVASIVRATHPNTKIIICADQDAWDKETGDPRPANKNIGQIKGRQAALACGGAFRTIPAIGPGITDFNDLAVTHSAEQIREIIDAPKESPEDQVYLEDHTDQPLENGHDYQAPRAEIPQPFMALGYDGDVYFYLPRAKKQIVDLSARNHTMQNLLQLAPLNYWRNVFFQCKSTNDLVVEASDRMMRQCEKAGFFSPADRLRGAGAWLDQGRSLYNDGSKLWIGRDQIDLCDFDSDKIYTASGTIPAPHSHCLTNSEAHALRKLCEFPTWENALYGTLLAGWIVIALICGMLKWRPHIWITGQSGSGKSEIINIIRIILGACAFKFDGGTTEAALRQRVKYDGRPIIYDEAEAEDRRQQEQMQGVLQYVRKASSGALVTKGTASGRSQDYPCRSIFCFSGINPAMKHLADETRITALTLRKNPDAGQSETHYKKFLAMIPETLTNNFTERLLARTLKNMKSILENCETFTAASVHILGSRRAADQIGPMLAGAYSLHSEGTITKEEAEEWIKKHDWTFYTSTTEDKDYTRLLSAISMSPVRVGGTDKIIGNIIAIVLGDTSHGSDYGSADETLRSMGIIVQSKTVFIANKSAVLADKLKNTTWAGGWARSLSDLPGAIKTDNMYFCPGHKSRAVAIPSDYFRRQPGEEG